ncbi:peptidoglycan-binding protein [Roseateles sp. SL47]|uniref:CIS tube protein n=1 Tax=Roseateles sp. SL47 TaxID=2995138 RepID=UPI00226ED001|nr:peptidoglycan-binding protein [Roseateles sp. SL47]WAC71478.1 peptidoglycan-binding protein [Roseateles sp. SL47]
MSTSPQDGTNDEGQHKRLLLTRYKVNKGGAIEIEDKVKFETQINPSDFKHNYSIGYNTTKDMGASKTEAKFSATDPEEVSFSIVLDDTGVVEGVPDQPANVKDQISLLSKVVYDYVSTSGEPPYVRLLWGALIFFGRLKSMSTTYSLFKPNGDPLRAKVDLSFVGASSRAERTLENNRASTASMTRTATAEDGDTVSALCQEVYNDCSYDTQLMVAKANGLTDLRSLQPGQTLVFPPMAPKNPNEGFIPAAPPLPPVRPSATAAAGR